MQTWSECQSLEFSPDLRHQFEHTRHARAHTLSQTHRQSLRHRQSVYLSAYLREWTFLVERPANEQVIET